MKTRLIMIIALTLAALALLLGLTIGRKNTKEPVAEVHRRNRTDTPGGIWAGSDTGNG